MSRLADPRLFREFAFMSGKWCAADSGSASTDRTPSPIAATTPATTAGFCSRVRRAVTSTTSGYGGAPYFSTRNSWVRTPFWRSATPSAFQNAGTASTRLLRRLDTAWKPIRGQLGRHH